MKDEINSPSYYAKGEIECIDAIQAACTEEEFLGWLKGSSMKYLWRWRDKGGVTDLEKAQFFINRLVKFMENKPAHSVDIGNPMKSFYPVDTGKALQTRVNPLGESLQKEPLVVNWPCYIGPPGGIPGGGGGGNFGKRK